MKRKLYGLVLAFLMVFTAYTVYAENTEGQHNFPSSWATEYVAKADRFGITEGINYPFTENITREQFCELAFGMLREATGKQWLIKSTPFFTDCDNNKVTALHSAGFIKGKGDRIFDPDGFITREEAATILDRMAQYFKLEDQETNISFDDKDAVSDWAEDSVDRICSLGIMNGIGGGLFDPKGNYTVEQSITTLVRVFDIVTNNPYNDMTFADKMNANMPADKNYMFSPLSVKTALMMAATGAEGETKDEILNVLGVDDLDSYNQSLKKMFETYSSVDYLKLEVANSIWINSDRTPLRFSSWYKNTLADIYGAASYTVTNENAVPKINGWVNEKTYGKIPSIIADSVFDAALVNAVYFKGRWDKEFNKNNTKKDIFTSKDGSTESIDFMNKRGFVSYAETDGVSIVALDYLRGVEIYDEEKDEYSEQYLKDAKIRMYFIMSDKAFNAEEVLSKSSLKSTYMNLSVPKFKIEYDNEISDLLKNIGLKKSFSSESEFTKMCDNGNMYMDSVIHKTYINVDEEGTEAAAVTAILLNATSALPPEPINVSFNKPFTFVIRDDANGEILFMGEYAYAEPSEE